MGKGFDSSWITPSIRGALSVRLVVEGAIIIIVTFVVSFPLEAVLLLALVFYLATHISTTDGVAQVTVILIMPSASLLQWSEIASQVPTGTLLVVKLVTQASSSRSWFGSTTIVASNIAWMRLTCTLTFSLSLGRWGGGKLVDEHS
jgi:hypothetical protein